MCVLARVTGLCTDPIRDRERATNNTQQNANGQRALLMALGVHLVRGKRALIYSLPQNIHYSLFTVFTIHCIRHSLT